MTIDQLQHQKEAEDKIEFKAATRNFPYNGGSHTNQEDRRKCYLGYIVAFANEGGGRLVLGMADAIPHQVVGSDFALGEVGALEDDVYAKLGIRIRTEELYDANGLRVLVTHIPSRPIGKTLKFDGVPLMRIGESLRNMSDEEVFAILSEQEPDFSAKICEGITMDDLNKEAIDKMKTSYARKQNNTQFLQLSNEQILSDLKLMIDGKFTYASLILLGNKEKLNQKLPQSKTIWEYRNSDSQIHHDTRIVIDEPLFIGIDKIWNLINQPSINPKFPIQSDAYIFDIYAFNEIVIREAVLNAVAHRDYSITSEVVIKQFPTQIIINNPGGFPKGVTIENLLTVSSTPRSRLMTDILEKTGLVERSGQGVDKIFSITLAEGKAEPDYTSSNLFQVTLKLNADITDKAFHIFLNKYQFSDKEPKLGVEQIITLYKIKNGLFQQLNTVIVAQLEKSDLIQKLGGHTNRYVLSGEYHQLVKEDLKIGKRYLIKEIELIVLALQGNALKVGDLESRLQNSLTRSQVKYLLTKLMEDDIVKTSGQIKGTRYLLLETFADLRGDLLVNEIVNYLRSKYE